MAFGSDVSSFMWIRAAVLLAIAPVLSRLTARAAEGSRSSFDRVRTLAAVPPVAIIGVDLNPGLCPTWYAGMQAVGALALIGVAFITRGSAPRNALPKGLRGLIVQVARTGTD